MRNTASDTLFKLREVPDDTLAEFLCAVTKFRAYRGVVFWRFNDGSYVWTRCYHLGPFHVAKPNRKPTR